jgi:hypothetical protein
MSGAPPTLPPEWHLTETYKGLITLSAEGLKLLALVNGGAAVAVLTYLGNLVSHTTAGGHSPDLKCALQWYCGGLFATTVAFVLAYVTQLALYNEEIKTRHGKSVRRLHAVVLWITVSLALFAAVAFWMGCLSAARALRS